MTSGIRMRPARRSVPEVFEAMARHHRMDTASPRNAGLRTTTSMTSLCYLPFRRSNSDFNPYRSDPHLRRAFVQPTCLALVTQSPGTRLNANNPCFTHLATLQPPSPAFLETNWPVC